MFITCSNPVDSNNYDKDDNDLTTVRIMLPSNKEARIASSDAQSYTNYYEVIFRRLAGNGTYSYFSENAASEDIYIEIEVAAGNYDILLLAGIHYNIGDGYNVLLASGYIENKIIISDEINVIDIILKTIDFNVELPEEVETGNDFDIDIEINTKNPLVSIYFSRIDITSIDEPASFENILYDLNTVLKDKTIYNYTCHALAPLSSGHGKVEVSFYYYPFHDRSYWYIKPYWNDPDPNYPEINEQCLKPITFFVKSSLPKIQINILWE
jgi:hypothetical protein